MATLLLGLIDQQLNDDNPRLFDFRGAIEEIEEDAGPNSVVIYEPPDMRYVLEYYAPDLRSRPLRRGSPGACEAARCSWSPPSRTTSSSSTGPTRSSGSSTSSAPRVKQVENSRRPEWGSSDEQPPVGRPPAQGDVEARAEVGERAHAGAASWPLLGLPPAIWYFTWLLNPDRIGDPVLYGILIVAELFNLSQAFGFWWTCANERVREARRRRASGWPWTCSCPSTRSRWRSWT